jgi:hypothetical protein
MGSVPMIKHEGAAWYDAGRGLSPICLATPGRTPSNYEHLHFVRGQLSRALIGLKSDELAEHNWNCGHPIRADSKLKVTMFLGIL